MAKVQSVEPNIADLANGWLKSYRLPYKLEQESLNTEIDQALNDYQLLLATKSKCLKRTQRPLTCSALPNTATTNTAAMTTWRSYILRMFR